MSLYRKSSDQREDIFQAATEEAERRNKSRSVFDKAASLFSKKHGAFEALDVMHEEALKEDKERGREKLDAVVIKEKAILEKALGRKIDVLPLPKGVTSEKLKDWKKLGFEAHYLPKMNVAQEKLLARKWAEFTYPGDGQGLSESVGGWRLVESGPRLTKKKALYENQFDQVGVAIAELRRKKILPSPPQLDKFGKTPDFSRVGLTPGQIEGAVLRRAVSERLNVGENSLRLPTAAEYYILMTIFNKHWRKDSKEHLSEWLGDEIHEAVPNLGKEFRPIAKGPKMDVQVNPDTVTGSEAKHLNNKISFRYVVDL